jgi:ElaB/YqjD/DUF883 family membrane-anchored ribosome-binding protein
MKEDLMKNPLHGALGDGHDLGTTARDTLGDLTGEYHRFLADIEEMIEATTTLTGEDLTRAKAALAARFAAARGSVADAGAAVGERARGAARVTDSYVHDNPWQAIGIGAAVGLLVGFMLARRR